MIGDGRLRYIVTGLSLAADPRSVARMLRIRVNRHLPAALRIPTETVALRLKDLDGETLHVRPGTSDMEMLTYDYAYGFHEPPPELSGEPTAIVELGSCGGAALAWYGARFPRATVVGVEPNPGNAAIARLNTERFGERVRVIEAGVWSRSTELTIEFPTTHGGVVRERKPDDGDEMPLIRAISVADLLDRYFEPGQQIDFLNISVEGAERHVLDPAAEWPARVRSIKVELQQDKDFFESECVGLLERMGFACTVHSELGGYVVGLRS